MAEFVAPTFGEKKAVGYTPTAFAFWLVEISLRRASYLSGLGINASSVEGIVNNLSNSRNIRINVHAITRGKVTNDAFRCDLARGTGQLRKSPRLNMINSLKPLSQRQALVKIHDSLSLLHYSVENNSESFTTIDAFRAFQDAISLWFPELLQSTSPRKGKQIA